MWRDPTGLLVWLQTWVRDLSRTYWFLPALAVLGLLGLGAVVVRVDVTVPGVDGIRVEGARALFGTLVGAMITVTGVTFSVTVAAVVHASSQYGPRLLSSFLADRGNQITLAVFTGTSAYALFVLQQLAGNPDPVPQVAVLIGLVLCTVSFAVLVYFVHHVPSALTAEAVLASVGHELLDRIGALGEDQAIRSAVTLSLLPPEAVGVDVLAGSTGYVRLVDLDRLTAVAERHDGRASVEAMPGDFVLEGERIGSAWGGLAPEAVAATVDIGPGRTGDQDPRFPADELVEIAARALSPGVNDPRTAMACIDWMLAAVPLLDRLRPGPVVRCGSDGRLRVVARQPGRLEMLTGTFGAVLPYAAADPLASRHLRQALRRARARVVSGEERDELDGLLREHDADADDASGRRRPGWA